MEIVGFSVRYIVNDVEAAIPILDETEFIDLIGEKTT